MVPTSIRSHVYRRTIAEGDNDSLLAIVKQLSFSAHVLDLGCGSGAIGRYLAGQEGPAAIDGVTLSEEEAALAAPYYRRVVVADLDERPLDELFDTRYDAIVCADVLEHLRDSAPVLAACKNLLTPDGLLLLSVPNTAYCGLIAELMAGEFRYRPEGLLDETHLRFFTRQTLLRFLADNGWQVLQIHTVQRETQDSEFRVAFDALPPAVARHILNLPDAGTYQFVIRARPLRDGEDVVQPAIDRSHLLPAQAHFTAELFTKQPAGYSEGHKISASGVIGHERQTVRFALPAGPAPLGLKLDPADRPGFLYLHALQLQAADGAALWRWDSTDPGFVTQAAQHQMLIQASASLTGSGVLCLLYGDDPWLELPIPEDALSRAAGGMLEVDLGWPMSADYLAMADVVNQYRHLRQEHDQLAERIDQLGTEHQGTLFRLRGEHEQALDTLAASHEQTLDRLVASHEQDIRTFAARHQLQVEQHRAHRQQLQARIHALIADATEARRARDDARRERQKAQDHIEFLKDSTVFRVTRPIVNAKMWLDRQLGRDPRSDGDTPGVEQPLSTPLAPSHHPVDIIVPVYKGLADTQRCVLSVLSASCRTPWRLIVINDASPEPEVTDWLRDMAARDPRVELLENEVNLGFVGTVNRGMAVSTTDDVLLLNSDAEVANDWLDRIQAAAYSDQRVASVTPFSNNATICSYPRFCQDNALPMGWDVGRLDQLFAKTNAGQVVDVPTGVGFCMYIRRAALDEVGLFDVENFGKGYGEENDFCIRAENAGWRNLHALDTFVHHSGGVSFGDAKSPRERAAMETLRRLHPRYEAAVMRFVQSDPARPARMAVDLARVMKPSALPVILAVLHDRQGGTERHVEELAATLHDRARFFILRPLAGHAVQLRLPDPDEGFEIVFSLSNQYSALISTLQQLGVQHVHFHHLLGQGEQVRKIPAQLGVTFDFTAHDFYTICPQISLTDQTNGYCGELGVAQCTRCLAYSPAPGGVDITTWRQFHIQFLERARYVIAPSGDALARVAPLAPEGSLRLVPHTDVASVAQLPTPQPALLSNDRPLKIAVIGALSIIKGADVLEDVALLAGKTDAPLDFHLIGYGYRALRTRPRAHLTVHGKYDEKELPALLDWLKPDLIWFPAQWPETYSYTLSACLQGGWPVVAPDLGAFTERLSGRPWSWLRPWNESAAAWITFFLDIRQRHFLTGQPPAQSWRLQTEAARRLPEGVVLQTPDWYAGEYLADIPAVTPGTDALAHIAKTSATRTEAHAARGSASSRARSRLLSALVRLRALPWLSGLARAIPLRWQTRVKNWLLR